MQMWMSHLCHWISCEVNIVSADEDATEVPVQERQIGFVFQSYALFRHMTLAENISFGPRIRKLDIDMERRRVRVPMKVER
jgi:sulfate transport system ATP-binding protein